MQGWFQQTSGTQNDFYSIKFFNANTGIVIGMSRTVLRTVNGGNNWVSYLSGSGWLYDIDFVNQQTGWACGWFGTILKSTNGGSVYAGENNTTVPSDFILQQNYPNPFNAQTRIDFTLNRESNIVLSVFDVSGKNVNNPAKGRYSAGNHSIIFDGSALPSGVYIYDFYIYNGVDINLHKRDYKKMILTK